MPAPITMITERPDQKCELKGEEPGYRPTYCMWGKYWRGEGNNFTLLYFHLIDCWRLYEVGYMDIGQVNAKLRTRSCGENTTNFQSQGDTISFVFFLIVRGEYKTKDIALICGLDDVLSIFKIHSCFLTSHWRGRIDSRSSTVDNVNIRKIRKYHK